MDGVKIDYDTLKRRELYEHFLHTDVPFWSVTYEEDVTEVLAYCHQNHIPFYHAMIYLVTHALNAVDAFHYAIRKDGIYRLEERLPSFTVLKPGQDTFQIITAESLCDSMASFSAYASALTAAQQEFLVLSKESDALVFLACLPWIKVTGLTNEGMSDPADSIPRIAWGRYYKDNERTMIGMCFEVNHRLIDGIHIGMFHEAFRALVSSLQ